MSCLEEEKCRVKGNISEKEEMQQVEIGKKDKRPRSEIIHIVSTLGSARSNANKRDMKESAKKN